MENLDDFTDTMRAVCAWVREHPDTTLTETVKALYPVHAEEMRLSVDPYIAFKNRIQKRLKQLTKMGYLSRERHEGKTFHYRVV